MSSPESSKSEFFLQSDLGSQPDMVFITGDNLDLSSLISMLLSGQPLSDIQAAPGFRYFASPSLQERIYNTSRILAEDAHDNDIADMVFIDRAARSMRTGIRQYWQLAYPTEAFPESHFINPWAFRLDRGQVPTPSEFLAMADKLERGLEESNSTLLDKKTQPLMLVDNCIHSGTTMVYTETAFLLSGFRNIRKGVFSDDRSQYALTHSDVYAEEAADLCKPFGVLRCVESHGIGDIYCSPAHDPINRPRERGIREEIQAIVRDHFAAEHPDPDAATDSRQP